MDDLVQSSAFMPPTSDSHESELYVLGDLTYSFEKDLAQLLHVKENAILQSFLSHVARAFRQEFATLVLEEQEWLPRFTDLIDLVANVEGTEGAPALRVALVCVYQVGRFIRYFTDGSKHYPSAATSCVLGICAGSFATAAIATSNVVTDLVDAGVESVLTAFRTGMLSLRVQRQSERRSASGSGSWSALTSLTEDQAKEVIEDFNSKNAVSTYSSLYISAASAGNVTISGPPRRLEELIKSTSLKAHFFPIESPFHAPHLFDEGIVSAVVDQSKEKEFRSRPQRIPIISPSSGLVLVDQEFEDLLRFAVTDALLDQVRWDKVLSSCTERLTRNTSFKTCTILPLASNSAALLTSTLHKTGQLQVKVESAMNEALPTDAPAAASANFAESKVAIIGFSGRFPEAASTDAFWELLRAGRDVHRTIPEDRFDWQAHFDPAGKKKNTSRIQHGCFINDPGMFDARFFNLSPREAESTDPAQRLALMATYEAIEMAGLVPNRTASTQQDRIGVFFGVTSDDWREVNSGQDIGTYFIPGGNRAFVPGRIRQVFPLNKLTRGFVTCGVRATWFRDTYFFGFSGPSLSIDTACSSSFASIQTACSLLWRGQCDTAIAGGTNVLTNPDNFAGLDRAHFLSTSGNCNAFDDEASGYCRADAVGAVILKRLEDAEADNDPIFGVIAAANTNHSAHAVSITRPHEGDQTSLFKRMIRHANINPLDVGHIEMHGTGTQAGDATEMRSVLSAFVPGFERMPRYPLHLGSVKANVGHSESASGVTSLIKVLLMMQKNEAPPHCGIKTRINHNYPLDLAERNVKIPLVPTPWRRSDTVCGKRVVFLNNFSAAGGNTALLLEDAPASHPQINPHDPRTTHLLTVTGKTAKSLRENMETLSRYVETNPNLSLPALSYTTTARRMHHKFRVACVGTDLQSIKKGLNDRISSIEVTPVAAAPQKPKVVFAFTGQGNMYAGMGKQLYESVSHFRADILRYHDIALKHGFPSFLMLVEDSSAAVDEVDTVASHLALTCIQMALYRLWTSWGVTPSAVTGHSLGEYAALFAAGVLSASDTIYLVGMRAHLLTKYCTKGSHSMLAIKASVQEIRPQLLQWPSIEVACVNSPTNTVVSGPHEEVRALSEKLQSLGHECIPLHIPYAFHSAQVDPVLERFGAIASNILFNTPSVPYLSPLLESTITASNILDASYLPRACRGVVNFQGALEAGIRSECVDHRTVWLEIGPHPICSGMIKATLGSQTTTLPSMKKAVDVWRTLTSAIESIYLCGSDIRWNEYHRDFKGSQQCLDLPRYSWDLKNYWIQYRNNFCLTKGNTPLPTTNLVGDQSSQISDQPKPRFISPSVQKVLEEQHGNDLSTLLVESDIHDPGLAPIMQGHKVNGAALCSSSLYADQALTMANYMMNSKKSKDLTAGFNCSNMKVDKPLIASPASTSQLLRITAVADWQASTISLTYFSVNAQGRKLADHATCIVKVIPNQQWRKDWKRKAYLVQSRIASLALGVDSGNSHKMKRGMVYRLFGSLVDYSSQYQGIQDVILDSHELEATAQVKFQTEANGYENNPCWVDSLGHIAGFIMNGNDQLHSKDQIFVNHGWDDMRCAEKFEHGKNYQTYNKMQAMGNNLYIGDTYTLEDGEIIAIFEGVKFQGVPRKVLDHLLPSSTTAPKPTGQVATAVTSSSSLTKSVQSSKHAAPARGGKILLPPKEPIVHPPIPKTNVALLMGIISEELGVPLEELDPTAVFADHGMDSLMSLTISSRIQDELKLDVPSSVFVDNPTVQDFCNCFGATGTAALPSANTTGTVTPSSPDSLSEADTDATSGDDEDGDDDLMQILRSTISEDTGVPLEELKPSTMLSEIGVDSLLSLNIMARLSERLGVHLSAGLLAENNTPASMEQALRVIVKHPDGTADAKTRDRLSSAVPSSKKTAAERTGGPSATSVRLQGFASASKKALFLFPDGSGSATSYATIPKVSSDVVVYGLNCPWMKTPQDLNCSLEQYASKYITEVRRLQPEGPYYFGGWSAGGIIAYEVAQQLTRVGERVEKLILIDSPNPVGLQNPPQRMYDFFESLDFFGMAGKKPPSWLRPHFDAFISMLDDYEVAPFQGPCPTVHMLYAKDGICKHPGDPRPETRPDDPREMLWLLNNRTDFTGTGWSRLVGQQNMKIEVLEDVNHFSMLQPGPQMQALCAFVGESML